MRKSLESFMVCETQDKCGFYYIMCYLLSPCSVFISGSFSTPKGTIALFPVFEEIVTSWPQLQCAGSLGVALSCHHPRPWLSCSEFVCLPNRNAYYLDLVNSHYLPRHLSCRSPLFPRSFKFQFQPWLLAELNKIQQLFKQQVMTLV